MSEISEDSEMFESIDRLGCLWLGYTQLGQTFPMFETSQTFQICHTFHIFYVSEVSEMHENSKMLKF